MSAEGLSRIYAVALTYTSVEDSSRNLNKLACVIDEEGRCVAVSLPAESQSGDESYRNTARQQTQLST